jgi:hypothetical protein
VIARHCIIDRIRQAHLHIFYLSLLKPRRLPESCLAKMFEQLFGTWMSVKQKEAASQTAYQPLQSLSRTVTVSSSEQGLVLSTNETTAVIPWGYQSTPIASTAPPATAVASCTVQGIVGVLRGFSGDFLVAISKAEQVAELPYPNSMPSAVFTVNDVLAIPLDLQGATKAIAGWDSNAQDRHEHDSGSSSEAEADKDTLDVLTTAPTAAVGAAKASAAKKTNYDLLGAYLWIPSFSKAPKQQDKALEEAPPQFTHRPNRSLANLSEAELASRRTLDSKILRELAKELRHGMYFSYDADATHTTQAKLQLDSVKSPVSPASAGALQPRPPTMSRKESECSAGPRLWQRSDPRFFWNKWLSRPFQDAKLHAFVYPIFQRVSSVSGWLL